MKLSSIIVNPPYVVNSIKTTYSNAKTYKMQLANTVTSINVVSSLGIVDIDKSKITSASLGSNVQTIQTSCFAGCENLKSVVAHQNLVDVGDEAFKGCISLKSVNFLQESYGSTLDNIGISAFADTGLESVAIALRGSAVATQVQPYAFAGCTSLKSMKNIRGNYLADYEFAGCTSLTSVSFPNSHSFVGECVFKDCTSLKKVVIPPNTFGIGEGMF